MRLYTGYPLQTEGSREKFEPHSFDDGSTTWPSKSHDDERLYAAWDRVKIDHFLASRPFGKWWKVVDDPADDYLGVLSKRAVANDRVTPVSDHELLAHEVKWVGPVLQEYAGDATRKTIVWGKDATTFEENGKTFYLTRNNMRTDVYLGQISDDEGNPILEGLTDEEKKTLLDCKSTDARFQQAIKDYCIDDHRFIGETVVTDGGTVIVDEDTALGGRDAALRLDAGTLRIAGTEMTRLGRDIILEGGGGTLDIAEKANLVTAVGVISGKGFLTKAGEGALNLTGTSTYTSATTINAGYLFVSGSIASSSLTTVKTGAMLVAWERLAMCRSKMAAYSRRAMASAHSPSMAT